MKSTKIPRFISLALMVISSFILVLSGVMKLFGAQQNVEGLTKEGLGNYIVLFGVTELVSVTLLWIPKTRNIGFFLICSYLGGALSIELAGGQPPIAAILLAFLWISLFLSDRSMFLKSVPKDKIKTAMGIMTIV